MIRLKKTLMCLGMACLLAVAPVAEVSATTIAEIKDKIAQQQDKLASINDKIDSLNDEQDIIEEKIDDLNAEIINTMASIGVKEEEIVHKEQEITDKQVQIDQKQAEYEEAKRLQEEQQSCMNVQAKILYENNSSTLFQVILGGYGLADILNRMDYAEQIFGYGKNKLDEFEATKIRVHELWDQLVVEKSELEEAKKGLEADKVILEEQKAELDTMLAQKKKESANFDAEIKKAKQEAAVAKKLIQQEQKALKKLEQEQARAQAMANKEVGPTSYDSIINSANGSDLGKKIAKYGCQFIGNPYVYGGTSLTKGADCSGFTYRIYADFGYTLPRTSTAQRSAGVGVSYAEAQPGDLICYSGHVGMYIGGGKIVHASNKKSGIKVNNANYRPILAVRRIIK